VPRPIEPAGYPPAPDTVPPMDSGYFGPDSMTWRINQEMTVLFGGVRALLMHAAHPLVAAGARQTAAYRRDPWARLLRTLSLQLLLPFGTKDEARHAADRINRLHAVIHGTDRVTGEHYDALDPELLLWVHACLEESTVIFYERTVRPLTDAQKQRFHEESLAAAELVLLPRERVPATYREMTAYVDEVVHSGRLMLTDVAREVADLIRGEPVPIHLRGYANRSQVPSRFGLLTSRNVIPGASLFAHPLKPIWKFISFAAVGTLPAEVRSLYSHRWSERQAKTLDRDLRMLKRIRPYLPRRFRLILPARIALRRAAGEQVPMPDASRAQA